VRRLSVSLGIHDAKRQTNNAEKMGIRSDNPVTILKWSFFSKHNQKDWNEFPPLTNKQPAKPREHSTDKSVKHSSEVDELIETKLLVVDNEFTARYSARVRTLGGRSDSSPCGYLYELRFGFWTRTAGR
jgi:hypothetical protein